jgi:hypothetical protein
LYRLWKWAGGAACIVCVAAVLAVAIGIDAESTECVNSRMPDLQRIAQAVGIASKTIIFIKL